MPLLQHDICSSPREDESTAASESGDGGAFASLSGGKMLISGYVQHVLWKNKQLSFLKLLICTPGGDA